MIEPEKSPVRPRRILCPTDLTPNSQTALRLAAKLAEKLSAPLTACHCTPPPHNWFSAGGTPAGNSEQSARRAQVEDILSATLADEIGPPDGEPGWRALVIENSLDAARDINNLALEAGADLVVLKARRGILSAFHYGSIVERVVSGAGCPVLIFPPACLEEGRLHETPDFRRVLLDYDFSPMSARLLPFALRFAGEFHSQLHLVTVLAPPENNGALELAQTELSRRLTEAVTLERLQAVVPPETQKRVPVLTSVRWGKRSDEVVEYARRNRIDLICTGLPRPYFYFEKIYSVYLGRLLQAALCPVLVWQSQRAPAAADFRFKRAAEIFF